MAGRANGFKVTLDCPTLVFLCFSYNDRARHELRALRLCLLLRMEAIIILLLLSYYNEEGVIVREVNLKRTLLTLHPLL